MGTRDAIAFKKGSLLDSHAQKSMGAILKSTKNNAKVVCWLGLDGGIQNLWVYNCVLKCNLKKSQSFGTDFFAWSRPLGRTESSWLAKTSC